MCFYRKKQHIVGNFIAAFFRGYVSGNRADFLLRLLQSDECLLACPNCSWRGDGVVGNFSGPWLFPENAWERFSSFLLNSVSLQLCAVSQKNSINDAVRFNEFLLVPMVNVPRMCLLFPPSEEYSPPSTILLSGWEIFGRAASWRKIKKLKMFHLDFLSHIHLCRSWFVLIFAFKVYVMKWGGKGKPQKPRCAKWKPMRKSSQNLSVLTGS